MTGSYCGRQMHVTLLLANFSKFCYVFEGLCVKFARLKQRPRTYEKSTIGLCTILLIAAGSGSVAGSVSSMSTASSAVTELEDYCRNNKYTLRFIVADHPGPDG